MEPVKLSQLVVALGEGRHRGADAIVTGVVIDSRIAGEGTLFVALPGRHVDGHDFIASARAAGAAAALVARVVDDPLPQWVVEDPAATLARLGARVRAQAPATVIGVTGSNGKTTVKEMIAAILSQGAETLATRGNLNNDLGVPLTLCRLNAGHRYAVIEMGANAPGDIARLAALAAPDVGVVTNAGPAHLSGFGDIAGVARAKGELFAGIARDGVAVINADDDYAPLWRQLADGRRSVMFGTRGDADIRATAEADGTTILVLPGGEHLRVRLPLPGAHNRLNAAAAAATALAAGASPAWIVPGLERMASVPGRWSEEVLQGGVILIDDSYNANPRSLGAAVEVLAQTPPAWVVLGDMGELGESAGRLHAEAGEAMRRAGIERVFALGPLAAEAAAAFGEGGGSFDDVAALVDTMARDWRAGVRVLVKGSRSAAMERVCEALRQRYGIAGGA
ncbi:UDP-N-acetylmuramoyl-tripeptide--D-alanyl-D-alanine ligase [wastewater metagenome]|uniref:UDP-MurNAc-pentapeptide synthetase n=2 Tax=unclassified sequences TaxID=12908 RepID=A0A5B8RDU4_9ZZZZ|nr:MULTISPECIES: UDP-N-acetylmuramoyl-tripeptide--D-alanyl-D-alanine ligase [Arhodomonas]MCS4504708.1 UDP-N-acetylmuramoyl-tripeptide--D-alanyl-D-alanine ligase [Arhodomonas aquaeolei]QEA04975.1 UDP-N-acetylmuramoyl-tripeptide--D-alanyl-D-alanine ligase [uncultured organism]